ncbi:MAG: DUF1853 family protein [Pseudomonadota bacterium]
MQAAKFKHPVVRDLAWAGFSEPLLHCANYPPAGLTFSPFWERHLAALDQDPASLLAFLGERASGRLGLYYERLWQYLLEHDPDIELIGHNVPVRDKHKTAGEFDCLYRCLRSNTHIHLELAVKFYLGVHSENAWLGPNVRDRLDRKVDHLTSRQIRLGEHPASRDVLAALGIHACEQRIDMKGYLFAPAAGMPAPEGFNVKNALQHWLPVGAFDPAAPGHYQWYVLPRARWLGPYRATPEDAISKAELLTVVRSELQRTKRPLQLVACDEDGYERKRCFVTPDDWPHADLSHQSE